MINPEKELALLKALEEEEKYKQNVTIVYDSGSSKCQILGEAEELASEKLDYETVKGVKMFKIEEVKQLFTGIVICREIVS